MRSSGSDPFKWKEERRAKFIAEQRGKKGQSTIQENALGCGVQYQCGWARLGQPALITSASQIANIGNRGGGGHKGRPSRRGQDREGTMTTTADPHDYDDDA